MGICISSASLEKNQEAKEGHENIVFVEESLCSNGIPGLASLYSKQGKKGSNQDSAILHLGFGNDQERVFCGVFDGHGRNGRIISKLVRDRLPWLILNQRKALRSSPDKAASCNFEDDMTSLNDSSVVSEKMFNEWKEACNSAFKAMDKELGLLENLDCTCSGTTAVTIINQGNDLFIANLGDSRVILGTISSEGSLIAVQLTTDLKPSLPEEAERIRKSNGRIFALKQEPGVQRVWLPYNDSPGLAMARSFGDFQLKNYGIIATPEITRHRLTCRDKFLVLATDGVWDVLSNEQVVSIVWSAENKETAARTVVDAAVDVWKQKFPSSKVDDCSVVCFFLHEKQDPV